MEKDASLKRFSNIALTSQSVATVSVVTAADFRSERRQILSDLPVADTSSSIPFSPSPIHPKSNATASPSPIGGKYANIARSIQMDRLKSATSRSPSVLSAVVAVTTKEAAGDRDRSNGKDINVEDSGSSPRPSFGASLSPNVQMHLRYSASPDATKFTLADTIKLRADRPFGPTSLSPVGSTNGPSASPIPE